MSSKKQTEKRMMKWTSTMDAYNNTQTYNVQQQKMTTINQTQHKFFDREKGLISAFADPTAGTHKRWLSHEETILMHPPCGITIITFASSERKELAGCRLLPVVVGCRLLPVVGGCRPSTSAQQLYSAWNRPSKQV